MTKIQIFVAATAITAVFCPFANAGDGPTIGGGATIVVSVDKAGVLNASGGMSGGTSTAKQAVGSVISGNISGQLKTTVTVGEAGVLNVGVGMAGGTATACQSVGTVGDNCSQ